MTVSGREERVETDAKTKVPQTLLSCSAVMASVHFLWASVSRSLSSLAPPRCFCLALPNTSRGISINRERRDSSCEWNSVCVVGVGGEEEPKSL